MTGPMQGVADMMAKLDTSNGRVTEEKIWGVTVPLIVTPMFELHSIRVKPYHRCSLHIHQFKHNAFYVLRGELYIDQGRLHGCMPVPTLLQVGHVHTVAPGVLHQFRTGKEWCDALEMYYTEPLSEDIHRSNKGGPA